MIDRLRELMAIVRAPGAGAGSIVATSLVSIVLRVCGILLSLLAQLYLARLLGAHQYGQYVIALGWAMLLVIVARRGLDNMALRVATHYWEERRTAELAGLARYSLAVILQTSMAILVGLAAIKLAWPRILIDVPWPMLLAIAAVVWPLAMLGLFSSLLRSTGRVVASQTFEQILRPAFLIGLLLASHSLWGRLSSAVQGMVLTVASLALAVIFAAAAWRRALPAGVNGSSQADRVEWHSVSTSFVVMALAQEALNQSGLLLLGVMGSNVEAAYFSAAWRYNSLLTFGLIAVGMVCGPLIASAHRKSARNELAAIARTGAQFSLAFAALAAVPLVLFGKQLLDLFGDGFAAAYPALLILLAASLVNASTGVVGNLVSLTGGHEKAARITLAALAVNLAANAALIPTYGAMGAAIASLVSQVIWNLALLAEARRLTGVTSWMIGPKI